MRLSNLGLHLGALRSGIGISVSIGSGFAITAVQLTATVNGLEGGEVITYQWQADGVDIGGATASTFTPAIGTNVSDADSITCIATVDGTPYTSNARIAAYALGTSPAVADGQSWTVDDTAVSLDGSASGANLTFSYALTGSTAGVVINSGTGAITGTPTGVDSGTAIITATDQYGRELTDTFTFTSALRAAATAADGLGPFSWTVDDTSVNVDATTDFTLGGNTLTYTATGLPTGVTIAANGIISGTPTAASSGSIVITGQDEYGRETTSTTSHTTALRAQATGGVDLDLAFPEDSAIASTDLTANWTENGNTVTYAITGTALPTGLSVSSAGAMTGTPTTITADATYTLRGIDEYGRTTDDTFTLEITELSPFTGGVEPAAQSLEPWQFPVNISTSPMRNPQNYVGESDVVSAVNVSYEVDAVSATASTDLDASDVVDATITVVEGGHENEILNSDLGAGWSKLRSSAASTSKTIGGVSISGQVLTAASSGGTNTSTISESVSVDLDQWYTFSFFAEPGNVDWVCVRVIAFTTPANTTVWFDTANGVVGTDQELFGKIEDVGGGVYRCSMSFKTGLTDSSGTLSVQLCSDNGVSTVPLDGVASATFYGAQFQKGRVATDFVATAGSAATSPTTDVEYDISSTVSADSGSRPVFKPTAPAHALVCKDTSQFNDTFNDGFAVYAKVEYDGTTGTHPIFSAYRTGGALVAFNGQNLAVSTDLGSTWTSGSTTLTAGTYDIFVRYDGADLSAWAKPHGGSIVKEIDAATVSFTASPASEGPVCWGGSGDYDAANFDFPENGTSVEYYAGAVWDGTYPSEANGTALMNNTVLVSTLSPFWEIDIETGIDASNNVMVFKNAGTPGTKFLENADVLGDFGANFAVMHDGENGQPVTYDAGSGAVYWAAYSTVNEAPNNSVRLATSTDLEDWTDYGLVFTSASANGCQCSEFLYLGNVTGGHDPFAIWLGEGALEKQILLYTSDDMSTWTADAANPVFTMTPPTGFGTSYWDGVEDFSVIKRSSDWLAVFEKDGYQSDLKMALGLATNTGTVPTGAWTLFGDAPYGEEPFDDTDLYVSEDSFWANPCMVTDGTTVYLFYEAACFDGSVQGPTTFLRTCPIEAATIPGAWTKHGCVTWESDGRSFPNSATLESGVVQIYVVSGPNKTSSTSDGVRKIAFDQASIYTSQALTTPS